MLQVVIRCAVCEEEIDVWDLDHDDPKTNLCEIVGDINFEHECSLGEEES